MLATVLDKYTAGPERPTGPPTLKTMAVYSGLGDGMETVSVALDPYCLIVAGPFTEMPGDAALCTTMSAEADDPLYEAVILAHPISEAATVAVAFVVVDPTVTTPGVGTRLALLLFRRTLTFSTGTRDMVTVSGAA